MKIYIGLTKLPIPNRISRSFSISARQDQSHKDKVTKKKRNFVWTYYIKTLYKEIKLSGMGTKISNKNSFFKYPSLLIPGIIHHSISDEILA